jgi:hypothetical protein
MTLKQIIFLLLRLWGTAAVAWIAAHGGISEDQATSLIVTIIVTVLATVWSMANKWWFHQKIETALELPAGSSLERLKSEMGLR